MTTRVRYESDGQVSTLTLDDGKANALSPAMLGDLNAALDRAEADRTVVLITGRAGMLSAGFDLGVFKQGGEAPLEMLKAGARLSERLLSFPAPTMIACSGHAIAMGAFMLLCADVRIGIAGGPFKIAVNEVAIGMTLPRFAVEVCRQRLSPVAFNFAPLTAEAHSPEQAREAGFLDYLVHASDLMTAARERATALAKLVRESHTASKRRLREQTLAVLRRAIELDIQEWEQRGFPIRA